MKLKNEDKIEAASRVLDFAIQQGFHGAFISLEDEDENFHNNIDDVALDYSEGDTVQIKIHLTLDEDLNIEITDENEISYP